MLKIRLVEEEIARVYPTNKIKSPVHLSIGQEAVSAGVCEALDPRDVVFGTYRSHALYIAKGGDLRKLIAELYGRATGCARGKGGSMHLIDVDHGVMGTSAMVATTIPQAVGYAYALKVQRREQVVVCFFGDGAVEEGAFHEGLNFAGLKKLPVLFVCENNRYAINTPQLARQPLDNICKRAEVYDIPALRIERSDVLAILDASTKAIADIRSNRGPRFLECMTYRWREHVGPGEDFDLGHRLRSEMEPWIAMDQVSRIRDMLTGDVVGAAATDVEAEIRDAFEFAERSPDPELADLESHVFEEG